jgi:hypothetical protein
MSYTSRTASVNIAMAMLTSVSFSSYAIQRAAVSAFSGLVLEVPLDKSYSEAVIHQRLEVERLPRLGVQVVTDPRGEVLNLEQLLARPKQVSDQGLKVESVVPRPYPALSPWYRLKPST